MKPYVIAVVGMAGSGKTSVLRIAAEEFGFQTMRFGQLTIDTMREHGLAVTPEHEKMVRENLRSVHGMGAYATLNIPKIEALSAKGNVLIDGLYSWSEYKILKEKYGQSLITLAVHSSPETRYARLEDRASRGEDSANNNRSIPRAAAQKRDYAEIEGIEKGGPIAMADHVIVNETTLEYFEGEIRSFLSRYASKD